MKYGVKVNSIAFKGIEHICDSKEDCLAHAAYLNKIGVTAEVVKVKVKSNGFIEGVFKC